MNSNEMIVLDLPSLQSITLGQKSIEGVNSSSCILVLNSIDIQMNMEWQYRFESSICYYIDW